MSINLEHLETELVLAVAPYEFEMYHRHNQQAVLMAIDRVCAEFKRVRVIKSWSHSLFELDDHSWVIELNITENDNVIQQIFVNLGIN